jgi:hypothetical protein
MPVRISDPQTYYTVHGIITDPKEQVDLLEGLPSSIAALCEVVQGCLIHKNTALLLGVEHSPDRLEELELRHVSKMLAAIRVLDNRPLVAIRSPDKRLIGSSRDFAVMLCALLRQQRVPARARCGFASYFGPNFYTGHWVTEYWNAGHERWVIVDAAVDEIERQHYKITIDTLNIPASQFLVAGKAWQMVREGQADPDRFGLAPDTGRGEWYIQNQLVRDLAALNKVEMLGWDAWGLGDREPQAVPAKADLDLLDRIAALTLTVNNGLDRLYALYQYNDRLRVPPVVRSYSPKGVREVEIEGLEESLVY